MRSGFLFQTTSKITHLARSGLIEHARRVFDEMPQRDVVAWNAMLTGYTQMGLHHQTVSLFCSLRTAHIRPDDFSFTATLKACTGANQLRNGTKLHGLIVVFGYQSFLAINNALIDMYGKCVIPSSAAKMFEQITTPNEISWCSLLFAYANAGQFNLANQVFHQMPKTVNIAGNILIACYARFGEIELCLKLLKKMEESSCLPDQWTFSALINACTESSKILCGSTIHGLVIKNGWSSAVEMKNSIFTFYTKLGYKADAMNLLESIYILSQVSWNAIIDAYMKVGDTHEALTAFLQSPDKNNVSWMSMITGYARNGHGEKALIFFVDMIRSYLRPDEFTFGAALHACSNLAVLGHGKMLHGCIIHHGFSCYTYVGNGLLNMYAKCGDLDGSSLSFDEISQKDLASWNSMLFALGLHGDANKAFKVHESMLAFGEKPDKVTFLGLLMTCSHSGLIEKGGIYFEWMRKHQLPHEPDHLGCMVDMLGRGGYIEEAKEFSEKCDGKSSLVEVETVTSYVLQSNVHCCNGQWKEAEMIRKVMLDRGLKKSPGCSWIETKNEVIAFVAGSSSIYPSNKEIHAVVQNLQFHML